MSKFIKRIILTLVVSSLLFVGCNKSISKNQSLKLETSQSVSENSCNNYDIDSENDNSNKSVNSSSNEYNSESTQNIEVSQDAEYQKQFYLNKLDELAKNLDETRDKRYEGTTTLDINEVAKEEYTKWDNLLNEIYSKLEQQLSQEEMDKLREEEIEWINIKNQKSKEAADKYKGGSIAPYMSISSQIEITKERCYELVNQYMN